MLSVGFISYADSKNIQPRNAYTDNKGIIRWSDSNEEVALFGANYCLPSACDYRAAKLFTSDLKKLVDDDMVHFARMGWDALRLCFWGDWENTDKEGNLIKNEHLDLLDYTILKARERGIYFLLSPVVTYSSLFPDAMRDTASVDGISVHFKKSELGTNPKAILAQCNYWKQLLNHINPYTGVALKDDPSILFLETINEPTHHSDDIEGSVKYINSIVEAIKSTGCKKLIFHNYTQDNKIGKSMSLSKIDGATFAWYPTGLNSGRTLEGNYLQAVDDFPPMLYPEIKSMPRIVYEFDTPDLNTGYMYPAMVRTFRSVGTQFATMFSYDMLASAPYNQGWSTHLLNLIYTPSKAASAIISAQAMKALPLYSQYGNYPENTSFGNFKVSYDENSSVMNTPETFIYSNSTKEIPVNPTKLNKIVGVGSSPIFDNDGMGIYFLDKVKNGMWRLEIYPDALTVDDPFGNRREPHLAIRLISRERPVKLKLPDLGSSFSVFPINAGNNYSTKAKESEFVIRPGVYVLTTGSFDSNSLPKQIGLLGFREFVCPVDENLPDQVVVNAAPEYLSDRPIQISAQIASKIAPEKVELVAKDQQHTTPLRFPMNFAGKYNYKCDIPTGTFSEGILDFYIETKTGNEVQKFEKPTLNNSQNRNNYSTHVVKPTTSLVLFSPEVDYRQLSFTRIGDNIRRGLFKIVDGYDTQKAISMRLPLSIDSSLKDYTASFIIKDRIQARGTNLLNVNYINFKAKGTPNENVYISLVEADGTTWVKKVELENNWKDYRISLNDLTVGRGIKLPQGYPENWNYWMNAATGRGASNDRINLQKVERLLISLRPNNKVYTSDIEMSVCNVNLEF